MEMLDEIVKEFLVESHENLDRLDRDLMALEDSPDDSERLSSIFRAIHTIKGTSGFLAFPKLEQVTHVGENLLVPLRDGGLRLNAEITTALLAMVDAVRRILSRIEIDGSEGIETYTDLIETLNRLRASECFRETAERVPASESTGIDVEQFILELNQEVSAVVEARPVQSRKAGRPRTKTKSRTNATRESAVSVPAKPKAVLAKASWAVAASGAAASSGFPVGTQPGDTGNRNDSVTDSSVRIDVHLLDNLMNLVGELVLARNQILQFSHCTEDAAMTAVSQRLNLITTELQEGVIKTRMQPILNAWRKLPRMVRELSISCGKQVNVRMDGAETELDKTILEAIRDPLTHIVRNSIDHGIETAEVRLQKGKPAEGTLWLRAWHAGGQVNIEIADDGAGINPESIRRKAVEKGLVTAEQAAVMSDREAVRLILLAGFSTADTVTSVSGRGVGMDVVKTNIDRIGGTLDIHSTTGVGTSLRIKIPLTLAIIPALVVTCEKDRYCIPQASLLELVRLEGDRARNDIELLHSVPVYRLRGQLLPLVYLDEMLGLHAGRTDAERRTTDVVNIVVLQAEDRQFGLIVDEINDTQEIVVKPLGLHIKGVACYAGATIMGDGTVSLILDVIDVAQRSRVLSMNAVRSRNDNSAADCAQTSRGESWLLVDPLDGTRAAIPLSSVARLEEIRTSAIEKSGRQQVVQYRGQVMPIVSLNECGQVDPGEHDSVSLVVYNDGVRNIGVVVGTIIDILSENADSKQDRSGATRVIAGRVTQIVDLRQVVMKALPL